jgi:CRP-like cAMP-binding protein
MSSHPQSKILQTSFLQAYVILRLTVSANELKQLELFCRQFKLRSYKKGQILISEDEDPEFIFCLLKGYVRKYYLFESGNELTIRILSPVAYFPLSPIVGERLRIFGYETMTNCAVVKIPKSKIVNFIKDKPLIKAELTKRLLGEYAEHVERFESLVSGEAYQKVISVILYLVKHFGEKSRKIIVVPIKFTHQDIATLAGITRETASISMKRLKDKKLIYYYNSLVTIPHLGKLKKELFSQVTSISGISVF